VKTNFAGAVRPAPRADGATLTRMAELLGVDELRQVSLPSSMSMRFVVRVGGANEAVEIEPDSSLRVETVMKVLFDAAARARSRAERDQATWQPLRASLEERGYADWIDYKTRAVSSVFGLNPETLDPKLLVVSTPSIAADSFEIRGGSQTVRVINVGGGSPAGRFAAIAEELKNT
jgi:hypothetical protein